MPAQQGKSVLTRIVKKHRFGRKSALRLQATAMIDVIFLLLTFFVLTARFNRPEQFLSMKVPTAAAKTSGPVLIEPMEINISAAQAGSGARISIAGRRELSLSEKEIERGLADFANGVVAELEAGSRTVDDPVRLICSQEASWDIFVKVYNVLYAMGIEDITVDM